MKTTTRVTLKQILNFIPVLLLEMNGAIGFIWAVPMLYRFKQEKFHLSIQELSLMGSMTFYGKVLGPLLVYLLIDRIGRKKFILLSFVVFTLEWGVLSYCKTMPIILITRLIFGVFQGANLSMVPVYAAENCYPSVRGSLMASITVVDAIGKLICFVLVLYLDYHTVHMVLFIASILGTMSAFRVVESTEYLMSCNRFDKAEEAYFKLRSRVSETDKAYFNQLQSHFTNNMQNLGGSKDTFMNLLRISLKGKTERKALTIVIGMMCLTYLGSAIGPLNTYTSLLFSDGVDSYMVNLMTTGQGVVFIIAAITSTDLMRRFKRKTVLTIGLLLDLVFMIALVLLYTCNSFKTIPKLSYYVYFCLIGVEYTNGVAIYPMINCFKGEILPQNIKKIGVPLSVSLSSLVMALEASIFWPLAGIGGVGLNFVVFSIGIVITLIYSHYNLPETKGKTLLEIEAELRKEENIEILECCAK